MAKVLPAVGATQEDVGQRREDALADGGQAWMGWRSMTGLDPGPFFPEPQVLQEGEGELAQEQVVMQTAPSAGRRSVDPSLQG